MDLVTEILKERMASGKMVGFSPWRDGEGLLFGYIQELDSEGFTAKTIGVQGEVGENEREEFSHLAYLDLGEDYIRRLELLADFIPSLPKKVQKIRSEKKKHLAISRALETQEFLEIMIRDEKRTSRVRACDKVWADLIFYTDLAEPWARYVVRIKDIEWIEAGSVRQEADGFVFNKLAKP